LCMMMMMMTTTTTTTTMHHCIHVIRNVLWLTQACALRAEAEVEEVAGVYAQLDRSGLWKPLSILLETDQVTAHVSHL
jgi:hypothetical protein